MRFRSRSVCSASLEPNRRSRRPGNLPSGSTSCARWRSRIGTSPPLRVLQEGEFHRVGGEQIIRVNVRVISATNRDLSALVSQDKFREDLFYRLSVVPIRVPALRERPHDIELLARYFLEDFCARNNFKPKALDDSVFPLLESYPWPGNARELRNVIERMAILTARSCRRNGWCSSSSTSRAWRRFPSRPTAKRAPHPIPKRWRASW